MRPRHLLALLFLLSVSFSSVFASSESLRRETLLEKGWRFVKADPTGAQEPEFDDRSWRSVTVPHDWAIEGPFSEYFDRQDVAIEQNGEKTSSVKTGRTGGLPYTGTGWYRTRFDVQEGRHATLVFDGAMSMARVYVNGKEAIYWPYGYNAFHVDVTPYLNSDGKDNVLAVRLENMEESSRWYPGAGLFRNVHLVETSDVHLRTWGTFVTTPHIEDSYASVKIALDIESAGNPDVEVRSRFLDHNGKLVAQKESVLRIVEGVPVEQNVTIDNPLLWTPEHPWLYTVETSLILNGELKDTYTTRFGIRTVEFIANKGMLLNGKIRKFKGVCNHHDLGPLGSAINRSALKRQLTLLKDMGCDAIRTSHNMPAPELVELCDEMGLMMMVEAFDEWDVAKCKNGYHLFFNEWAEKDLVNMVRHFRNSPSVFLWSIGNEVPTQGSAQGYKVAARLADICHREDPTRKVTAGLDQVQRSIYSGFASVLDVPGLNYRDEYYQEAYEKLPQGMVLGSETASTVSSRGVYKFPVALLKSHRYEDNQSSGYDTEACSWSNIPELDFALADDYPWTMGQFVWTGFDYLGEPTPYDSQWPSHSSLFGIIDLSSQPKDRYWLYRSVWNPDVETLHIVPHWNWEGREGQVTPIFVYSNYDEVELIVNGRSMGCQHKYSREEYEKYKDIDSLALLRRYRFIWENVRYEKGEISVIAFQKGREVARRTMVTAGKPDHLVLEADRREITADGKDLAYITVKAVDKNGYQCPWEDALVSLEVSGSGKFKAAANGDATCLDLFHAGKMHLFGGSLTAIVESLETEGQMTLKASAKGLKSGTITISAKKNP